MQAINVRPIVMFYLLDGKIRRICDPKIDTMGMVNLMRHYIEDMRGGVVFGVYSL